ncbi:MAG: type 4a pilus biogenesis protein PilO [Phycisphaerales bacterium]
MNSSLVRIHAIGSVVVSAIIGAGLFFGLVPELDQNDVRRSLMAERAALQTELETARREQRDLREELVKLQDLGAGWAAQRAERVSLNQGMARIGALAKERDLTIRSMSAGEPEALNLFIVTPIEIEGSGGYDALGRFMSDIIDDMSNVTIERFDARRGRGGGSGVFTMSLAWYADGDR